MDSSKNVPFFTSLSMSGQGQIPPRPQITPREVSAQARIAPWYPVLFLESIATAMQSY